MVHGPIQIDWDIPATTTTYTSTDTYQPVLVTGQNTRYTVYILQSHTLAEGGVVTVSDPDRNSFQTVSLPFDGNSVFVNGISYALPIEAPVSSTIQAPTSSSGQSPASITPSTSLSTSTTLASSTASDSAITSSLVLSSSLVVVAPSSSWSVVQTTLTTSPPVSPSCKPAPSQTGKIAGAAVGTGVGAAILAFLLTFFIMRSRRKSGPQRPRSTVRTPNSSNFVEKEGSFKASPIVGVQSVAGGASGWMEHLPQPADDQSILRSIRTLYQQIELHVENFYSDASVGQISDSVHSQMFKVDSGLLTPSLYDLMLQSNAKSALIKHSLAHLILTNIDFNEASETSFLPSEFVGLNKTVRTAGSSTLKPATSQAFSQYRVLAAYLRPDPATDNGYLQQRDSAIYATAKTSCNAFRPWASHGQSDEARFNNLVEIMRGAADVGIVIFAQPASYSYRWRTAENGKSSNGRVGRTIVVLPAFVKITDDAGNRLSKPQNVVREVSANL